MIKPLITRGRASPPPHVPPGSALSGAAEASPSPAESVMATSIRIADMSRLNITKDMTQAPCGGAIRSEHSTPGPLDSPNCVSSKPGAGHGARISGNVYIDWAFFGSDVNADSLVVGASLSMRSAHLSAMNLSNARIAGSVQMDVTCH